MAPVANVKWQNNVYATLVTMKSTFSPFIHWDTLIYERSSVEQAEAS